MQAELVERRDQYRAVLEHNPHPTWIYALDSLRFLDVNQVAVRSYGWSRDEFLAMTIAEIRPREDVPALLANVARMRDHAGGSCGPWRHVRKDGRVVDVEVAFLSFPHGGRSARLIVATPLPVARVAEALSPREREVLCLVARGFTSPQIAEQLELSPKSVDTYRARFARKLGLRTRAQIVAYALDRRLLCA